MKALIIVPAYNEEANIEKTIENIKREVPEFDHVIINDCSRDSTKQICEKNGYNVVNLPINLGIGGAVQTGYLYGYEHGYDYAVQIDGDGQHDPSFLRKMLETIKEEELDMVIGSRFIERKGFQSSVARRFGIRFFQYLIFMLTGQKITDATSGLRMVNRDIMECFSRDYPRDYPEPESIVAILKAGYKVKEIPVVMREREGGVSSISGRKAVYYMVKVTLAILIECMRRHEVKRS